MIHALSQLTGRPNEDIPQGLAPVPLEGVNNKIEAETES